TWSNEIFSRERLAGYDPGLLAGSVALIVGAGALGQNVAQNLALSGLGELRIVDRDIFEPHNRTRSPAFPLPGEQGHLGLEKATVVAHKLRRLMTAPNPIMRFAQAWIQELGDGAFKNVSIVFSCVDTPGARAYLADKSRLHGIAYVEGGFDAADVSLSCFRPAHGERAVTQPCWRCSHQDVAGAFSCKFYAERIEVAGFIPAIQNAAAALGALQSEAGILALHASESESIESYALDLNIRTGQSRRVRLSTDPLCPGVHKSIDGEIIRLETSADSTVEQLLLEIGKHFPLAPAVEAPFPIIWTAPCLQCKEMVGVKKPDWLWMMDPRCDACKEGVANKGEEYIDQTPRAYKQLSHDMPDDVLKATCGELGLPPLSIVEATVDGNTSKFFELAGSVDHIFKLGDFYEQQ
ncbi:MAG TPA: ThiF family adenylyltransferase, partial [Blastocatellia bacterium]